MNRKSYKTRQNQNDPNHEIQIMLISADSLSNYGDIFRLNY